MARSGAYACVAFLFLLVLASGVMQAEAGARPCESPSNEFKGLCLVEENCAEICRKEGFSGGHCRGIRMRCFCKGLC